MQTSPLLVHLDLEFDLKSASVQILQALEAVEVTTSWCYTNLDVCRVGSTAMLLTLVDFSHLGWLL